MERLVRFFAKAWTDRQKSELKVSLDEHLKYMESLPKNEDESKKSITEIVGDYDKKELE